MKNKKNKLFKKYKIQLNQKWQIVYFLFIMSFLIDQISKYFIKSTMEPGQKISIIGNFFQLEYVLNGGIAFGNFQNIFFFTHLIPIIMIVVFIYLIKYYQNKNFYLFTIVLMLSGTLGNFSDRIFNNGYVVDFLSFNFFGYKYPAFNFADCFLVISVIAIIIESIITSRKQKKK